MSLPGGSVGAWVGSESIIMGEGLRLGGVIGLWGIGSNDSIPGRRSVCCIWLLWLATGSETLAGGNCEGVMTWFSLLAPL